VITHPITMTVAAFDALPGDGHRHELVRGELRVMPPPKGVHGVIEAAIMGEISHYLRERAAALGWTPAVGRAARDALVGCMGVGEVGLRFALPEDAHQTRGADGVYIPPEQLAQVAWPTGEYFPAVPALVVEVVSASHRAAIAEKVRDYLAGGARRVWVFYPEHAVVHVHEATAPTRVAQGHAVLTDEDLLPGFTLPLSLIFGQGVPAGPARPGHRAACWLPWYPGKDRLPHNPRAVVRTTGGAARRRPAPPGWAIRARHNTRHKWRSSFPDSHQRMIRRNWRLSSLSRALNRGGRSFFVWRTNHGYGAHHVPAASWAGPGKSTGNGLSTRRHCAPW